MGRLSFQIIEDNRLKDKPLIQEQIKAVTKALSRLGVVFFITPPRKLTWDAPEPCVQYRSDVSVNYSSKRGMKLKIMTEINSVIPAPYYKQG